tara:strand:+ start:554 stop:724 length:171 start_codon:yes stop_codon:yes gene_type:complete
MEIQEHILTNIILKLGKIKGYISCNQNNIAMDDITTLIENIEKIHADGRYNETTSK